MESLNFREHAYALRRFPLKHGDRLRAWDAADEYLLRHLDDEGLMTAAPQQLLLVNDSFGALGVALHELSPVSWSDSYLAWQALEYNLIGNDLGTVTPKFVPADEDPTGPFTLVLLKLPKSLTFFADQLHRLRPLLAEGAGLITGGMIKHTPKRAYQLLEEIIGPTTTTLGWKKARLAVSHLAERPDLTVPRTTTYQMPGQQLTLQNLPNVFSRERPDAGTRLLLSHLPQRVGETSAVDLGCGNGILAVGLAKTCPLARILCIDESYQAVANARLNIANLGDEADRFSFLVGDGLNEEPAESVDLVICNPPFHQGQTMGDLPAWTMFAEAERVLRPGGELRIVGNRHLAYHAKLKRLFASVEVVASDERFVVLSALKKNAQA